MSRSMEGKPLTATTNTIEEKYIKKTYFFLNLYSSGKCIISKKRTPTNKLLV